MYDSNTYLIDVQDLNVGDTIRPVASPDVEVVTITDLHEYRELVVRNPVSGFTSKRFVSYAGQVCVVAVVHLPTSWGPAGASACGHEASAMVTSGNPDEVTCVECKGTDEWLAAQGPADGLF